MNLWEFPDFSGLEAPSWNVGTVMTVFHGDHGGSDKTQGCANAVENGHAFDKSILVVLV